ncbi:MAG TPA: xylulokinase [Gaiella sp.]
MGPPALVGLDVGTTGVKALALSPDGDVLATATRGYELSTPRPGWAEQDPGDWLRAAEAALAEVADGREVAGIGFSGQMHGLVVVDDGGQVIRPAILWNDQRTVVECAEIEGRIGLERLIALTGNRALPGFTAPKLLWLRRHEPDAYARVARVMLPKDYVRLGLTGEWAIDASDASGTLLLDVARRDWSAEVVDALEIPRAWLPPVLESPEQAGATTAGATVSLGIPVAVGAGDQPAAAVGVGATTPGTLSVVLGTSGVVLAPLPAYAHDAEARVHAFCHARPATWQAMGVMLSAAGSLQWLHDTIARDVSFDDLVAEAQAWPPGAEGLSFLPYLAGERTPHADPDARGAFVGLELRHDRGALVRAVLEGVAFGLADSLDLLRALGVEPTTARVSGGGARSRLWLEIVAAVLGVPLELTESEEGSALGAALLGGVAGGVFADVDDAVARCVRVTSTVEPDAAWHEAYLGARERYQALYPALRAVRVSS